MSARVLAAAALALALVAAVAPATAVAGDSTDNCTGFITAARTITEQGVWCLANDVTDAYTASAVIRVTVNNVTIDCNGHLLVGMAGLATARVGIQGDNGINNLTVRNCDIRGFYYGLVTGQGSGHLVEDNRFVGNTMIGIYVDGGSGHLVRRNLVQDTGGTTIGALTGAIRASADIIDNTVDGLLLIDDESLNGIVATADDSVVSGNVVRGFAYGGSGGATGIATAKNRVAIVDNTVTSEYTKNGYAISAGSNTTLCMDNRVTGFVQTALNCTHAIGNMSP